MEDGNIIGLTKDNMNISLEPGGQLELSGAPLKTVHETCGEVHAHLKQVENLFPSFKPGNRTKRVSVSEPRATSPVAPTA